MIINTPGNICVISRESIPDLCPGNRNLEKAYAAVVARNKLEKVVTKETIALFLNQIRKGFSVNTIRKLSKENLSGIRLKEVLKSEVPPKATFITHRTG